LRAFIIAIPQPLTKMQGLIIATHQNKEKIIDVNFYLNVHFRICMSLIHFVHFNWSFFEIPLTFITPKPSDVQLLSTRHVTKVTLLQKFLDPQKHALN
jgi:hypothetical protein